MTDHNDHKGPPTPSDGDYDPIVAERFRVLERITPPNVASPAMRMAVPRGASGADPSGRRSGFLVAVAACVGMLVVGVIAVVAVTSGDGSDLGEEAGQTDDVAVAADGASDATAPLVVEGDSGVSSTTRVEADGAATATDDAGPAADGSGGTDVADQGTDRSSTADAPATSDGPSQNDATGSGDSVDPATTTADGPAAVMPADDTDRPIATFSTATTDVLPPTAGGDSTVALRGTVTEVFTDCVSRLVLTETGQVVQGGPISCDGGSYIVVGGTRVFTSSGFTSADLAFDKHPSNLKPGQEVSVTAVRTGGATGPLTLNCDSCRVRIV